MADQSVSPSQFYTTLQKWIREVSDYTLRTRLIVNRLMQRRRVSYNHSGKWCEWPIQIGLPDVYPYTGGSLEFPESDKYREMHLKWRMFYAADSLDEMSKLQNRGEPAIVKRMDHITSDIRKALMNKLCWSFYADGDTQLGYPHGLESFLTEKAGTLVGDKIAQCDDDYAGTTTDLMTYGGSWDAAGDAPANTTLNYAWPNGEGDEEFDASSPKILNVGSTAWPSEGNTVSDNLEDCISQGITWLTLLGGEDVRPDLCILSPDWWETYKGIQRGRLVNNMPHTPNRDVGFTGLGFNQDGAWITTEYGVPSARGYLISTGTVELRCMYSQLFKAKGPDETIEGITTRWATLFAGQWCFQPKNTGKIKRIAYE